MSMGWLIVDTVLFTLIWIVGNLMGLEWYQTVSLVVLFAAGNILGFVQGLWHET
jgi:hypothetical protein